MGGVSLGTRAEGLKHQIILRPRAETDIAKARQWYEDKRPGLGEAFLDDIERTLAGMAARPYQYPAVYRDVRRAVVKTVSLWRFLRRQGAPGVRRGLLSRKARPESSARSGQIAALRRTRGFSGRRRFRRRRR